MEIAISVFLGGFLVVIGIISYIRINKDFSEGDNK